METTLESVARLRSELREFIDDSKTAEEQARERYGRLDSIRTEMTLLIVTTITDALGEVGLWPEPPTENLRRAMGTVCDMIWREVSGIPWEVSGIPWEVR
jgi:hypothetical protein